MNPNARQNGPLENNTIFKTLAGITVNDVMHRLFSTIGLITMIVVIIVLGIILGLISLILENKKDGTKTYELVIYLNQTVNFTHFLNVTSSLEEKSSKDQSNLDAQTTSMYVTSTILTILTSSQTTPDNFYRSTQADITTVKIDSTSETSNLLDLTSTSETTTNDFLTSTMDSFLSTFAYTTTDMFTSREVFTTSTSMTTTKLNCANKTEQLEVKYNQTCPNNTIYYPSYLQTSTAYNYGYPIMQTIVCYGAVLELACPSGQLLHVYAAYYGIQDATNTRQCSSSDVFNTCFGKYGLDFVKGTCESQPICALNVLDSYFGEPCVGLDNRQLFVQYQCVDVAAAAGLKKCPSNVQVPSICAQSKSQTGLLYQNYSCEPDTVYVTCPANQSIRILCAFYGVDANVRCKGRYYAPDLQTCYSSSSYAKVAAQCNGKSSCSFDGNPGFDARSGFIKVCRGTTNMLLVQWECTSGTTQSIQTSQTSDQYTSSAEWLPSCDLLTCTYKTGSPYEPNRMDNSTRTILASPIYEQTICENSQVILKCPQDLVVHVHAAYYGIQASTYSQTCSTSLVEIPTAYVADSFEAINGTCEYKNECFLTASTANLAGGVDLFPTLNKQLFIQYQCMSGQQAYFMNACNLVAQVPEACTSTSDTRIVESLWCDGNTMNIQCPNASVISIECAVYGLYPGLYSCNSRLSGANKPVCYFKSSFQAVDSQCSGQNNCTIANFTSFFTDPCNQLDKGLYVKWKCI